MGVKGLNDFFSLLVIGCCDYWYFGFDFTTLNLTVFIFLRFNVIFLVVKLLIKVNEIKVKKGVELAQHLVEFYYAQVK